MEKRTNGKGSEEGNGGKAKWLELKEQGPEWSVMEKWQGLVKHSILAQGKGLAVTLTEGFEKGSHLIYIFKKSLAC